MEIAQLREGRVLSEHICLGSPIRDWNYWVKAKEDSYGSNSQIERERGSQIVIVGKIIQLSKTKCSI